MMSEIQFTMREAGLGDYTEVSIKWHNGRLQLRFTEYDETVHGDTQASDAIYEIPEPWAHRLGEWITKRPPEDDR